ncbi:acyltransferase family protein [Granulicella cerasi]|uniref:acyltransferase family protein n=1 Tax=Granulicella cerasi TaxID=741063 RepID=UPI0021DF606A|nr:acyltransferase [Granulicella cerasi]
MPGPRRGLSPRVVASLDAARAVSAIYVVLHHLRTSYSALDRFGYSLRFGQEAVLVFFLLSGFVIFANEKQRALRPRGYFLRRLRRIYPPLLVAMLVSTAVALANHDLATQFTQRSFWGTLLSVQDVSALKPGVITDPYLGNDPLWSLSYEIAFYIIFPLVLRAWTRREAITNHGVGLLCCLLYVAFVLHPNHFLLVGAYFLVWWAGAMAAEAYLQGGDSVFSMLPTLGWLLVLTAIAVAVAVHLGIRSVGYYPALPARHFAVAALMLVIFFSPLGRALGGVSLRVQRPAVAIASISYGLYILHFPLLIKWHGAHSAAGFCAGVVLLIVLSYLTERQLPRLLPKAPRN